MQRTSDRFRGVLPAATALALTLGGIAGVQAQSHHPGGLYLSGALSSTTFRTEGVGEEWTPTTLGLALGARVTPFLGLEGRLGFGLASDRRQGVDLSVSNYSGIYARGILPVTPPLSLYGLLGAARVEGTVTSAGVATRAANSGLSYGLGLDFMLTRPVSIGVEWLRLNRDRGDTFDNLSLTTTVRF